MKSKIIVLVLIVVWAASCTRETSTESERKITTQTPPIGESINATAVPPLSTIKSASAIMEQTQPTAIERACSNTVQTSLNSNSLQRWIHGSWVKVRTTPTGDETVLTYLTTNTQVQLSNAESKADFCEITWGNGQHGFTACRLLGNKPLTIEDIGPRYILASKPKANLATHLSLVAPSLVYPRSNTSPNRSDDTPIKVPNPNYSPTCAFWIEPNLEHLLEVGSYFENVMLTPEQKDLEDGDYLHREFTFEQAPPLPRFKIPEFEAMKDLMKTGLIAPFNSSHPKLQRPAAVTVPGRWIDLKNHFDASLMRVELLPISVSYFKSMNEIGRPSAGTEELSHHFQIPYSMDVVSGPSWERDEEGFIFKFGSWDMGAVQISLVEHLQKHTISNHGVVSSQTTSAPSNFKFHDSTGDVCIEGFQFGGSSVETAPGILDTADLQTWRDSSSTKEMNVREVNFSSEAQITEDTPLFYFYSKKPLVMNVSEFNWEK